MIASRLQRYLGSLIDLGLLSPVLKLVFGDFQKQSPSLQNENIYLEKWPAVALTLFFILIAYGLFFRYVLQKTPGQYLIGLSRRTSSKNVFSRFRMPKSVVFSSLSLILIFSTLMLLSPSQAQFQIARSSCPEIDESAKTWISQAEPNPSRISLSLALFEAELLPVSCLEQEAQIEILHQHNLPEAYFALALAQPKTPQIEFNKICGAEPQIGVCLLAKDLEYTQADRSFASVEAKTFDREYFKISQFKNLEKNHHYEEALVLLDKTDAPTSLAPFISQKRFEILWKLNKKSEARSSYLQTFSFIPSAQRLHFSQIMCELELLDSCDALTSRACKDYDTELVTQALPKSPLQTTKCMSSALAPLTKSKKQLQD